MRNYSFQFEVERLITMFISAMDDIVVKRYNVHKRSRDQIRVRFVYAPKQRVLHDLLNKAQNLQLPVAAVSIGGITRDVNRVFNKIAGSSFYVNEPHSRRKLPQPVPIDLTLNLSFLTRYQSDMDQCISNFLPYCDPYFVISWRIPEMPDHEIRTKVEWSGNVNLTYPDNITSTVVARVQADTSFTLKGWIFKAFPSEPESEILTIKADFSTLPILTSKYSLDELSKDGPTTERFVLSACPQPTRIEGWVLPTSATGNFTITGKSFHTVRNIYLSSDRCFNTVSTQSPFSTYPNLSAKYPSFTGVKLLTSDFIQIDDHTVSFVMPSAVRPGYIDVFVQNDAGYGSLIKHTPIDTFNPYPSGTYNWENYKPYKHPYASGVKVIQRVPSFDVISINGIDTISGDTLLTILGDYIKYIQ
jgi:hypothetical protein